MKNLNQNFKYLIILLIILILGILIFGNYNLNLSLIERFDKFTNSQKLCRTRDVNEQSATFLFQAASERLRENRPR